MLKEKTRRSLRAVLASACALSLAASMAFPLAAIAQSGSTAEADQLVAVDTSAEASAEVEMPVVSEPASQPIGEDATAPAPTTSEPAPDTSTGMDTATESTSGKADDTEAPDDTNADTDADADTAPNPDATPNDGTDATPDPDADDSADSDTNAAADTAPDQVKVQLNLTAPFEIVGASGIPTRLSVTFPSGTTFAAFRQQQSSTSFDREKKDFFFDLGTGSDIPVGAAHPLCPGYTFSGWFDLASHKIVGANDPISAPSPGADDSANSRVLYATWTKNGSNVAFYNLMYAPSKELGARISVEGILEGVNIPEGASLVVGTEGFKDEAVRKIYEDEFKVKEFLDYFNPDMCSTVQEIVLYVNGVPVHDGFGSLSIGFGIFKDRGLYLARIWHKHKDGRITYEEQKTTITTLSPVVVTDLSVFGVAAKPTSGDDGNQDGTKPPATEGDDNQDNANPPAGDNGNGQGNNSQGNNSNSNGTQGTNNSKNSGGNGLPKTGDNIRYALAGSTALLACSLFTGGMALLLGNRSRSQTSRARGSA